MEKIDRIIEKGYEKYYNTERSFFDFICDNGFELWKSVKDFPRYEVSTMSRVKVVASGKLTQRDVGMFLKQHVNGGYDTINVHNDNGIKPVRVHTLVAQAFISNFNPKVNTVIDHIDNNKLNNKVNNLRWVTQTQNMQSHHDGFRMYKDKEIMQYDLNGNFIREWENANEILKNNKHMKLHYLMSRIDKNKECYGYLWKKKHHNINELRDDEIFKNIGIVGENDFSKFEMSTYGKIKNVRTQKFLKQRTYDNGYILVHLTNMEGKVITTTVHRLVAFVFVELNRDLNKVVNHIDKNKSNNHYKNLEWVTIQQNTVHGIGKKVNQINLETGEIMNTYECISDAYRALGKTTCNSHISRCCNGKEESALGYGWKYASDIN